MFTATSALACAKDDASDDDGAESGSGETNASQSGASGESGEGESGTQGTDESGETGGTPLTCDQAATEADCDEAYNPGEDSPCSWLPIHEISLDRSGGCVAVATERGVCAQRFGLDDGCNFGNLCDGDVEAYIQSTGTDTWDLATGPACRGVPGFEDCTDDTDVPCSCACALP